MTLRLPSTCVGAGTTCSDKDGFGNSGFEACDALRGSCTTHSSGVSATRSTTSRNARDTPVAVFADVSTNKHPIRAAYASASSVDT